MSAAKSLGSHQLNSFAAFLKEKLHTSLETSIVQNPQLKKMDEEKHPQKGGKRHETNTAFEISEDIYMHITAHLMRPLMARRIKISARCAFSGLNKGGHGNGGSTAMSLLST